MLDNAMINLEPFFREAGSGPSVVCLHSNASSSAQWHGLMDLLAPRYRVLAPDSYGAGKSPDWHSDREIALQDEIDFIEPILAMPDAPLALVGHSYGAAMALIAALRNPARVRALALYEPVLFSLVDAQAASPNGVDGIRNVAVAAGKALDAADTDAAARYFIDFWMGPGSWAATPLQRKPAIAGSTVNVRRWWHALSTEPAPLDAFAALDIPVLYMLGSASPESSRAVARRLVPVLPNVRVVEFAGLGHMAPVTHAGPINAEIATFLSMNP